MNQDIQIQLAQELASLRTSVDNLQKALMGNGQPGIIKEYDDRITKLENWRWWVVGMAVGAGAAIDTGVKSILKAVIK